MGVFGWLKVIGAKKKNVKKMGQFSGTHALQTTGLITFKFGKCRVRAYNM